MTTYSLGITGLVPGQSVNLQYDIPDANISGNACATAGGMLGTMATGNLMLCKGPDGLQRLYRYDTERSTPTNPVLLKV
jgi:hypothetical protein